MPNQKFTLGTRGSLLAITQSQQILDELKEIESVSFDVKKIKTQGDQIVDKPLWQMDGKDFFTKELDEQLLAGSIDFVVHSYKDLGSERPKGIELAAITKRSYPHDILLIRNSVIKKKPKNFVVGTSSPRRTVNLQDCLQEYLPWKTDQIEIKNLRGNVNTRIEKLVAEEYDAIVLAFAGIERLAKNIENQPLLQQYFFDLNYMILPLSEFPTAAAQGALALEVGPKTPEKLKKLLQQVHCQRTEREVRWEKEKFKSFGGGCHLPMGISAQEGPFGMWTLAKGKTTPESSDSYYESQNKSESTIAPIASSEKYFVGLTREDLTGEGYLENDQIVADEFYLKRPLEVKAVNKHIYITSKYVLHAVDTSLERETVWCAGTKSLKRLAQAGIWVNGTSDQFGEPHLMNFFKSALLQLLHGPQFQKNIAVLTNADAPINFGKKVTCYERHMRPIDPEMAKHLKSCQHFFWTSFSQYQSYCDVLPELLDKKHYCGLGKSADRFHAAGVAVTKIRKWNDLLPPR